MVIFDSNIWIALFHTSDNQHLKAIDLVEAYTGKIKVGVSEYVMTEVCSMLLFNAGWSVVSRFIKEVIQNPEVEILYSSPNLFSKTLKLFQQPENIQLSFIDTSLLYLARFYEVITFDKALAKAIKKLN